jgi:MATE family multidrug resistance protein
MWNGLWLTLFAYLLVFLPFAAFLPEAFALMRGAFGLSVPEPFTVMEVEYGRILLAGMLFALGARGISNYFYGIHRPAVVMFATVTGNLVNFVFTIALVFGVEPLGVPALGVHGAAIATVIGAVVECSIPFALFVSRGYEAAYGTRSSWRLSRTHMKELIKLGLPAGLMWGNEVVCWWIFLTGFVATFDTGEHAVHNAAGWIVLQYMHLSFMPAVGFSIALSAVVGKSIGAKRDDLAHKRVVLGVSIAMAYMGLCALLFVIFRGPLVWLYAEDQPPEVREELMALGGRLLIVASVFQVFDALAITLSGALRGAGDTLWPGVATIATCWTFMVGGGWAFVTWWPELGSTGPWIGAASFIIALSLALLTRYTGGKWRTMSVVRPDGTAERPLPMPGPSVESDSHVV